MVPPIISHQTIGDSSITRSSDTCFNNIQDPQTRIQGGVFAYKMRGETTVEEVMKLYEESQAQFISLLHVGTDGWIKALDFVPFSKNHLRDVLTSGERADGSSLFKGAGLSTRSSDICLRPRLSTVFVHPFTGLDEPKGLCILADHLDKEGKPLAQSPSTILEKAQARVKEECTRDGKMLELYALGEVEYFLGRKVTEKNSTSFNLDKAEKGYHATSPFLFGTKLRRRATEILTQTGFHVKYCHGEVGCIPAGEESMNGVEWEQHEIEMSLMPLQQAADAVVLCQWILRNLASKAGFMITFDPMVSSKHAGNGLHFHMSATKEGIHLHHYSGGAPLSLNHPVEGHKNMHREIQCLIAGLCLCGGSLMAWGNRAGKNSFLRLSEGKETPTKIQWDFFNRKALVRLPIQSQTAKGEITTPATVEYRLGDGSAHPHLLLAGIAQAFVYAYHMDDKNLLDVVNRCRAVNQEASGIVLIDVPRSDKEIGTVLDSHKQIYVAGGVFHPSFIETNVANLSPAQK